MLKLVTTSSLAVAAALLAAGAAHGIEASTRAARRPRSVEVG